MNDLIKIFNDITYNFVFYEIIVYFKEIVWRWKNLPVMGNANGIYNGYKSRSRKGVVLDNLWTTWLKYWMTLLTILYFII